MYRTTKSAVDAGASRVEAGVTVVSSVTKGGLDAAEVAIEAGVSKLGDHDEDVNPEWNKCHACVSWIPICGGWCIPTVSPEVTWFRMVSNENSMFKMFGKQYRLRHCLEHSKWCRRMGGCGCRGAERWRPWLMMTAAFCSVAAWFAIVVSAFGTSSNADIIRKLPWAKIEWKAEDGVDVTLSTDFGIDIFVTTLQGIATNGSHWYLDPDSEIITSAKWGDPGACDLLGNVSWIYEPSRDAVRNFCEECEESSLRTRTFIWMTMATQLFQIGTDLQRLTPFGDLNCQKTIGWFTSFLGLTTGIISIVSWLDGCWRFLPEGVEFVPETGDDPVGTSDDRIIGVGCGLMLMAVLLKLVDGIVHVALRTPDEKQQPVPYKIAFTTYCKRNNEPTRWGRPINPKPPVSTTPEPHSNGDTNPSDENPDARQTDAPPPPEGVVEA